jgi:hypothetical protein
MIQQVEMYKAVNLTSEWSYPYRAMFEDIKESTIIELTNPR